MYDVCTAQEQAGRGLTDRAQAAGDVFAGARERPAAGRAPGEATADSPKSRPDSFKRMLGGGVGWHGRAKHPGRKCTGNWKHNGVAQHPDVLEKDPPGQWARDANEA